MRILMPQDGADGEDLLVVRVAQQTENPHPALELY